MRDDLNIPQILRTRPRDRSQFRLCRDCALTKRPPRPAHATSIRLGGRQREPKPDLETRSVVEHLDPRVMKAGDRSDQAETETVSRRVAAVFEPEEALENLLVLVGRNSGPIIRYRYDRPALIIFAGHDDLP